MPNKLRSTNDGWELYDEVFNPFETAHLQKVDGVEYVYAQYDKARILKKFMDEFGSMQIPRGDVLIVSERWKDKWRTDPMARIASSFEALKILIEADLGFGGSIVFLSETAIVATSSVFSDIDYTLYCSDKETMQDMFALSVLWIDMVSKEKPEDFDSLIDKIPNHPLILKMGTGMMIGKSRITNIFKVLLEADGLDFISKIPNLSMGDIQAIYELKKNGASASELKSLFEEVKA